MNESQGNSNDGSGSSGKDLGEGSMVKGKDENCSRVEKKNCNKEICRKKDVGTCQEILADLGKIKSVTSNVLADNRKVILSANGTFQAGSFICYLCLVHEPVNSLVHHVSVGSHKAKESLIDVIKEDIKVIICRKCHIILIGFPHMIKLHFTSNFHKNLSGKNCQSKEDSYTVPKDYELIVKGFVWVPRFLRKIILFKVFDEFGEIKKINVSDFKCSIYFKDSLSVKKKLNTHILVDGDKVKLQWREIEAPSFFCERNVLTELSNPEKLSEKLKKLIEEHHKIVHLNEKVREARVCESILNAVEKCYPGSVCYIFGSRLTGLSFQGSDLDVYLDCGNFYYGDLYCQDYILRETLEDTAKCLKKSPEFQDITVIRKARVPLVKIKHVETGITCDISFKNGLAVENSALIKFMVSIDERTKPMLLFVKYWMKKNNFYGRPYFSSYVITLLVLYYLAQRPNPVLPTIYDLRSRYKGPEKFIAGWDCSFLTDRKAVPKTKNKNSIPQLLLGFFSFYEKFDFTKNAISPLTGSHISREDFKAFRTLGLPHPYPFITTARSLSSLWNESDCVCVMDPFDLSYNLTQNFPKISLKHFYYSCGISAHLLSETILKGNDFKLTPFF